MIALDDEFKSDQLEEVNWYNHHIFLKLFTYLLSFLLFVLKCV